MILLLIKDLTTLIMLMIYGNISEIVFHQPRKKYVVGTKERKVEATDMVVDKSINEVITEETIMALCKMVAPGNLHQG